MPATARTEHAYGDDAPSDIERDDAPRSKSMGMCALLGAILNPRDLFSTPKGSDVDRARVRTDIDTEVAIHNSTLDRPPSLLDIASLHPSVDKDHDDDDARSPVTYQPGKFGSESTPLI